MALLSLDQIATLGNELKELQVPHRRGAGGALGVTHVGRRLHLNSRRPRRRSRGRGARGRGAGAAAGAGGRCGGGKRKKRPEGTDFFDDAEDWLDDEASPPVLH